MDELLASLADLIATELTEGRADIGGPHQLLIDRLFAKYSKHLAHDEAAYQSRRDWVLSVLKQSLNPAPVVASGEPLGAHQE